MILHREGLFRLRGSPFFVPLFPWASNQQRRVPDVQMQFLHYGYFWNPSKTVNYEEHRQF